MGGEDSIRARASILQCGSVQPFFAEIQPSAGAEQRSVFRTVSHSGIDRGDDGIGNEGARQRVLGEW